LRVGFTHRSLYALGGCSSSADEKTLHISCSAEKLSNCEPSLANYYCGRKCLTTEEKKTLKLSQQSYSGSTNDGYSIYDSENKVVKSLDICGVWERIQPMRQTRCNFTAVSCSNYIYAIGGQSSNTKATNTVEKYDPESNNWTYSADMKFERSDHAACVMDGRIYVVGGRDRSEEAVKAIECYDPDADTWNIVGETEKLYGHSIVAF